MKTNIMICATLSIIILTGCTVKKHETGVVDSCLKSPKAWWGKAGDGSIDSKEVQELTRCNDWILIAS